MFYTIDKVLSPEEFAQIQAVFTEVEFVSGKMTAFGGAAEGKDNLQLPNDNPKVQAIMQLVLNALKRHPEFYRVAYPRRAVPPLFSRYQEGMTYGEHTDAAMMRIPSPIRTDVAVTLFLSDPDSYDGGELVVRLPGGERRTKLPAGSLVAYPPHYLHRVEPVTRGVRYAAVTWVESLIRDPEKRVILSELDQANFKLTQKLGHAEELRTLNNTFQNLLRMWMDT